MVSYVKPPIVVSPGAVPAGVASLARTLFGMVAAWAVGAGYIDADNVEGIGLILAALGTAGWGIYQQYARKQQVLTAEPYVPNSVMRLKK